MIKITAKIRNIIYTPTLCEKLDVVCFSDLSQALATKSSFLLEINTQDRYAISHWVTPKRTRTYPYARVYDTLSFSGKRVTIIPIFKDEGKFGDRDFLQWDSVSLMSLLDVHVIIGYYDKAERNLRHAEKPKITNQQFERNLIYNKLSELLSYQSSALHWNVTQLEHAGEIGDLAIDAYRRIGSELDIPMHSAISAQRKINKIKESAKLFRDSSRQSAASAANREAKGVNPRENVSGQKGRLTIVNYLGGEYNLTTDEVWIEAPNLLKIVEAKHTTDPDKLLASTSDIKDALVKMMLFTNLEDVRVGEKLFNHESIIKLTCASPFNPEHLTGSKQKLYTQLLHEAAINNFSIVHT